MAFLVETGAGTPGANAYGDPTFVTTYLTDRNRETENSWSTESGARQQEACVEGTSYLDQVYGSRLKGIKLQRKIAGRVASGLLQLSGQPSDTETLTVGVKVYRLVNTLAQENDILIGSTVADTVANIITGINGSGLDVTTHEDTQLNYQALAEESGSDVAVAALVKGENGNLVAFSTTITGATITGSGFLSGGLDEKSQPLEFPRDVLYDREGELVVGVPLKIKEAMAEAAVRSLSATLMPDPTVDDAGALVESKREKVGPIEEETVYAGGGQQQVRYRTYPVIDKLMDEFLKPEAMVSR